MNMLPAHCFVTGKLVHQINSTEDPDGEFLHRSDALAGIERSMDSQSPVPAACDEAVLKIQYRNRNAQKTSSTQPSGTKSDELPSCLSIRPVVCACVCVGG